MPKYFFTTDDGATTIEDADGLIFPNDKAATDGAQEALADMAMERLPNGCRADFIVRVDDEIGDEIYRASLKFESKTKDDIQKAAADGDAAAAEAAENIASLLRR